MTTTSDENAFDEDLVVEEATDEELYELETLDPSETEGLEGLPDDAEDVITGDYSQSEPEESS